MFIIAHKEHKTLMNGLLSLAISFYSGGKGPMFVTKFYPFACYISNITTV